MRSYRGIFPGFFTMGNVVFGFLSILSSFEGDMTTACWFVILAGACDVLDGKVARLSHATSQFGVELDSLADFLSFGVAPAVIVHSIKLNSLGKWGWVISIVYIMAAAYRLARYNLMAEDEEKKDFVGMPVPLAAFGLVSYVIFSYNLWNGLQYDEILVSMIIAFAFLMVSQVQYDAIPDQFSTPYDRLKLAAVFIAAVAVVVRPRLLLFPVVIFYILFGLGREAYRLLYLGMGKVTGDPDRRQSRGRRADDGQQ
jgi:CDP-diacylglycerol--serine O-phosphatidyltransferase